MLLNLKFSQVFFFFFKPFSLNLLNFLSVRQAMALLLLMLEINKLLMSGCICLQRNSYLIQEHRSVERPL